MFVPFAGFAPYLGGSPKQNPAVMLMMAWMDMSMVTVRLFMGLPMMMMAAPAAASARRPYSPEETAAHIRRHHPELVDSPVYRHMFPCDVPVPKVMAAE